MKIVNSLDEYRWAEFVLRHPEGNIFHTPEMFNVFNKAQGYTPTLWAVTDAAERILALFIPVQITLSRWFSSYTTRAIAPGSVLADYSEEGRKALELILRTYKSAIRNHILFTEFRNLSSLGNIQSILQDEGFQFEEHLNYLINLERSTDEILQSFGSRTRKHIRRGMRNRDFVIEEVTNQNEMSEAYYLLDRTYRAAKVPLAHKSLFDATFNFLASKNMARITLARVDQKYVATSVDLIYKDNIYGWYGGTDRNYSAYAPTELITWDILCWGAKRGYRFYDFGGAGNPDTDSGIRNFKAKFRGELVNYGRNKYIHAPIKNKISEMAYQFLRRLLF